MLYSCYMTQLDVPSRQTTPTRDAAHPVLDSSFRCLDKEGKRPQIVIDVGDMWRGGDAHTWVSVDLRYTHAHRHRAHDV